MKQLKHNPLFIFIIILSPLLIYWLTLLLPTFDDWGYFTTPDYYYGEHFYERLIPRYTYWRPWDCLFGYVLSLKPALFPALNHIAVYMAHLGGTYIVYRISQELRFSRFACSIAALYFFISPAMLGTVLGIDSLNQAYSSFWGLLATFIYLQGRRRTNIALWLLCALIGTLAKENAITYFIIPQIIALAFGKITLRQGIRDTVCAAAAIAVYFTARTLLTTDAVFINDEYFENTAARKLKNVCVFLGMTWLPLDFVSLVFPPTRNLTVTAVTMLLSFPFMAALFAGGRKSWTGPRFLSLAVCLLIAAAPHLLTLFTAMHPYAGLGMAALITGYMADESRHVTLLKRLLPLFIISCIFIDWHHWQKSYESGLTGRRMAKEIIGKTGKRVDRVFLIIIEDDEPKYSSFCVIPRDAFGQGKAVCSYNNYEWPKTIDLAFMDENEKDKEARIDSLADMAVKNRYETVWLLEKDRIDKIR